MTRIEKVLYTARTRTTGGRDGTSRSSDGRLDIKLSPPATTGLGTNPEQLLAAGWSACFESAMRAAAKKMKVPLPADLAIVAEVDLGMSGDEYLLQARFSVCLRGIDSQIWQDLVEIAHQICPYSKATRGNIEVTTTLV